MIQISRPVQRELWIPATGGSNFAGTTADDGADSAELTRPKCPAARNSSRSSWRCANGSSDSAVWFRATTCHWGSGAERANAGLRDAGTCGVDQSAPGNASEHSITGLAMTKFFYFATFLEEFAR